LPASRRTPYGVDAVVLPFHSFGSPRSGDGLQLFQQDTNHHGRSSAWRTSGARSAQDGPAAADNSGNRFAANGRSELFLQPGRIGLWTFTLFGQQSRFTHMGIQPAADNVSRPDSQPVASPVSLSSSQVTTNEQAQAILKNRGVIWQRLDQVANTGEWKFSCSLPNPQNPRLHRTYEGTAPDSLGAIRAVLDKIEKDQ